MKNKPSPELQKNFSVLKNRLKEFASVCIAFSGGVDSTFLLKAACEVLGKEKVMAITVNGAMLPDSEFKEALDLAKSMGVSPLVINADVFSLEAFVKNQPDRCYHCKKFIFSQIKEAAFNHGITSILDGTNLDDTKDYRPGIKALEDLFILSPLRDASLSKENIRELSAFYALKTANKPAMACLATRIKTNTPITPKALAMVESGEELLKNLGLRQYRLRLSYDLANIECDPDDFLIVIKNRQILLNALKKLGIKNLSLDLAGYRCGNMN